MTSPLSAYIGAKIHVLIGSTDGPIHESFLTGFVISKDGVLVVRTSKGNFTEAQILEVW